MIYWGRGQICGLNIIVHHPKDNLELIKKVAGIHADFAVDYVQELSCPKDQKRELLEKIRVEK